MRPPEVLAPAGDEACLRAAIGAGADAVYFGLSGMNARARATNFTDDALEGVMRLLHRHGVKGYVTLNTLAFDDELPAVDERIRRCAGAGVDAVIVQDLAVARRLTALAPALPLHASTQMTCTDTASVRLAASLGARRVVLARELSLPEIVTIRRELDAAGESIELEVFVHGALCVAYSGQCLTSEALGGRSAPLASSSSCPASPNSAQMRPPKGGSEGGRSATRPWPRRTGPLNSTARSARPRSCRTRSTRPTSRPR